MGIRRILSLSCEDCSPSFNPGLTLKFPKNYIRSIVLVINLINKELMESESTKKELAGIDPKDPGLAVDDVTQPTPTLSQDTTTSTQSLANELEGEITNNNSSNSNTKTEDAAETNILNLATIEASEKGPTESLENTTPDEKLSLTTNVPSLEVLISVSKELMNYNLVAGEELTKHVATLSEFNFEVIKENTDEYHTLVHTLSNVCRSIESYPETNNSVDERAQVVSTLDPILAFLSAYIKEHPKINENMKKASPNELKSMIQAEFLHVFEAISGSNLGGTKDSQDWELLLGSDNIDKSKLVYLLLRAVRDRDNGTKADARPLGLPVPTSPPKSSSLKVVEHKQKSIVFLRYESGSSHCFLSPSSP